MNLIKRLLFPPMPQVVPPPRPEKVEERALKDRLITEQLEANARGRVLVEKRAKETTSKYLDALDGAMAIYGDRI